MESREMQKTTARTCVNGTGWLMLPDLPTSTNRLWGTGKGGNIYLRKVAKQWKADTRWRLLEQLRAENPEWEPLDGDLSVRVEFINSRLDIDNGLKALFDACNRVVWNDDCQIVELHVVRHTVEGDSRVHMNVFTVQGAI